MTERGRMIKEMVDASTAKHAEALLVLRDLRAAIAAVEDVRRGEPGAVGRLVDLCQHVSYAGSVLVIPVDELCAAETERRQLEQQLEALDSQENMVS